jgi:hypothetical protein
MLLLHIIFIVDDLPIIKNEKYKIAEFNCYLHYNLCSFCAFQKGFFTVCFNCNSSLLVDRGPYDEHLLVCC